MKSRMLLLSSLSLALLLAPQSGFACGEGIYAMGKAGNHKGYLAPRPATVLIYNDEHTVPAATKAVYRGLVQAGHTLDVARNTEQLATALRGHRYDVVIASYDQIDAIAGRVAPVSKPDLLPIVTVQQRSADEWRKRFKFSLVQGAGLGQYLKLIDKTLKDGA